MYGGHYKEDDADEFLDRVEDITSRVEKILSGDANVTAEEEKFFEEQKLKEKIKEMRKKETEERISKGIKGKGYKGNFKTFCKGCQTEYHHEAIEICNRCGLETVSYEVSHPAIQSYV